MLDRKNEYIKMARVEREHWWYRTLHHLVLETLRRETLRKDISILDAGCGTGGLLLYLRQQGYTHLKGFDLSPDAVEICHQRGVSAEQSDLRNMIDHYPPSSTDVIVSNDALYFLNEQERAGWLSQCFGVLRSGGLLILNLPALKAFAGIHDISVGIGHRFSMSDLHQLIDPDQFRRVRRIYWPFLLSPIIYAVRLRQRRKMKSDDYKVRSDIDLPSPWLNRVLEGITRFENRWLPMKPFGSSLYVVLRKRHG